MKIEVNIIDMYLGNADFRAYVDKYAKQYNEGKSISVEEALDHMVVKEYALWLTERSRYGK